MDKQETNNSISKLAFERTKKTFTRKGTILAILFIVLVITIAFAIFDSLSLFLTVPLLVMPATFAFMAVNTILDTNINKDGMGFFMLFKSYFSPQFSGGFRIIISYLKSILFSLLSIVLTSIVFSIILETTQQDLINSLVVIMSSSSETMSDELMTFISENQFMNNMVVISTFISFGSGFMYFVHSTMVNGFKYYFNLLGKAPILARDLNVIHSLTYKKIKKSFNKDYYKSIWFIPLLILIGFIGGTFFASTLLDVTLDQACSIGLFGSLLFSFMFIPYYFDVTLILFRKYQKDYLDNFIQLSIETLNEIKKNTELSEEKEKEIMDFLNSQKNEEKAENEESNNEEK